MSEAKKSSAWVWISLGLIIGLFVAFIFFLDRNIVKNGRRESPPSAGQGINTKPVFDFYKVLPERKMDIPAQVDTQKDSADIPNKKEAASRQFIVQAGSFQSMQDADRQKAELTLKGFEPVIKTAKVKGVSYYRVELGPFDEREYSKIQKSLIQHDVVFFARKLE